MINKPKDQYELAELFITLDTIWAEYRRLQFGTEDARLQVFSASATTALLIQCHFSANGLEHSIEREILYLHMAIDKFLAI